MRKDRRWADRYINASRPVQYDDEGRAHYMDEDDDDDTVEMYDPHALVEPDRYINNEHGRSARIARQKASNPSLRRCLLYTSPSPRDQRGSRMPSSA